MIEVLLHFNFHRKIIDRNATKSDIRVLYLMPFVLQPGVAGASQLPANPFLCLASRGVNSNMTHDIPIVQVTSGAGEASMTSFPYATARHFLRGNGCWPFLHVPEEWTIANSGIIGTAVRVKEPQVSFHRQDPAADGICKLFKR